MVFSVEEGVDVGEDGETPVVEDYGIPAPYKFTGKIDRVTIDLKEMKSGDREKADGAQKEASMKKALSD
jgi:arylsulfatase